MRNCIVKVPATEDQSPTSFVASQSSMETFEENALWTYNKMREHDGQPPLKRMPYGTKYENPLFN
jgi:hypothetical protein